MNPIPCESEGNSVGWTEESLWKLLDGEIRSGRAGIFDRLGLVGITEQSKRGRETAYVMTDGFSGR